MFHLLEPEAQLPHVAEKKTVRRSVSERAEERCTVLGRV